MLLQLVLNGVLVLHLRDPHPVAPELELLGLLDLVELVHRGDGLNVHVSVVPDGLLFELFDLEGLVIGEFFA